MADIWVPEAGGAEMAGTLEDAAAPVDGRGTELEAEVMGAEVAKDMAGESDTKLLGALLVPRRK
jgi:hypothetical protein